MHDVAERQEIFGEIGAILPGHTSDQSDPPVRVSVRQILPYANELFSFRAPWSAPYARGRNAIRGSKTGHGDKQKAAQGQ